MKTLRILCCLVLTGMLAILPAFSGGQSDSGAAKQYVLKFNHVLTP